MGLPLGGFPSIGKVPSVPSVTDGANWLVDSATAAEIHPIVLNNIAREARLMTDEAKMYRKIGREFREHGTTTHAAFQYVDYEDRTIHTNTVEGYFSIGWSIFTLKYSHAFTDLFGIDGANGSGYLDLALSQGFAESWTFDAHVGHQRVDGFSDLDYTDWSLGVSRDLGNGFGLSLAYVDTNADKDFYTNAFGKYVGKATGILTLSKDF